MDKQTAAHASEFARDMMSLLDGKEYHNQSHAKEVVETGLELAESEGLSAEDKRLVRVAGWFHDVGHLMGSEGHEELSAGIADAVLQNLGVEQSERMAIRESILATEVPQSVPDYPVAQVIADADLASLGYPYPDFRERRTAAYYEFDWDVSSSEWTVETGIPLLEHQESQGYHTSTAQNRYGPQVSENLDRLRKKVSDGPPDVLVGGTFDYFHDGHYELLRTAFGYGNPTIGITSDELASTSRDRTPKEFWLRESNVRGNANALSTDFCREYEITKLTETTDVAVTADADILVISPEKKTMERAEHINESRQNEGREALEIIVCDEVTAEDGGPISSTRIHDGEIDSTGKIL